MPRLMPPRPQIFNAVSNPAAVPRPFIINHRLLHSRDSRILPPFQMHQRPPRVTLLRDVFHSLAGTWTLNRRLQSEHTAEPSGTCTGTATFTVTQPSPVLDSDGSLNLADAQLLYHEQGEFEMFQNPSSRGGPIPKFTFSRKYIWRLQATDNTHTISVWFTKPGTDTIDYLFHKIDVPSDHNIGPTSTDTMTMTIHGAGGHLCVEDFYSSSYEFHLNQNETDATPRLASFTTTHEVRGPKKDQLIETSFKRK